jgi:uncharacterized protein (UPF0261 family)
MVNSWALDSVPERFHARRLHKHNPNVTLMRTNPAECQVIGAWIAERVNACDGQVRFLIPEKGVSALNAHGQLFLSRSRRGTVPVVIEGHEANV